MPAREPLVTFIVPCYNYGRFLPQCLDSIFGQTIGDFEVIVIDDHSSDETASVLAGIRDPRVRVIAHEENRGLLFTLTEGFSLATGTYVARLDADDRYRPYFLEETIPLLERYPDAGLAYGDVASMDEGGVILEDPWPGIPSHESHAGRDSYGDEFLQHIEDNAIPAAAVVGRREIWRQALPFPPWFTYSSPSDWYLNLRVARTHPLVYTARTLADYRLHPGALHHRRASNREAEHTAIHVLDEMLSGDDRLEAKAQMKRRLYGKAFIKAAEDYFGEARNRDARRCYLRAFMYRPDYVFRPPHLRRVAATFLDRQVYEAMRRVFSR